MGGGGGGTKPALLGRGQSLMTPPAPLHFSLLPPAPSHGPSPYPHIGAHPTLRLEEGGWKKRD